MAELVPVGATGASLGQYHHCARYTDSEVDEVLGLFEDGLSNAEISRRMEMPKSTVWAICHGVLRGKTPVAWRLRRKSK